MQRSRRFRVRFRGALACFTRPEMKVERVSYEVMTPSAARGAIESILWKPAIRWEIHEISVCAPIRWTAFRRNEVNSKAGTRGASLVADEDRAQRNTVALRDVDYVVTASFVMTKRAGPSDNLTKFEQMFERRLENGQCFQQPYLGCRELAADFEPVPAAVTPIESGVRRPLGYMLYDLDFPETSDANPDRALFFDAWLDSGVLHVPARDDVLRDNQAREVS